jgi:hypothetical protein
VFRLLAARSRNKGIELELINSIACSGTGQAINQQDYYAGAASLSIVCQHPTVMLLPYEQHT